MRNKNLLLLFLLALGSWHLHAQEGLKLFLPPEAGETVQLSAYTGLDLVVVDTLVRDRDGFFVYDPVLPMGMYIVDYKHNSVEFISVGKPIVMTRDEFGDDDSFQFVSSPENTRWMAYQKLRDEHGYKDRATESYHRQLDSLLGDATDYAARLIRVDADSVLRSSHFQDPGLIPTNVVTTKIVRYLERSDNYVKSVDHILGLAKVDMNGYEFALQYLLKGFTAMGLSEVTDHLLNFPQLAEGEISAEEGQRLERLTEPYQKVRVGAKAPNYEGLTINEKYYSLYGSQAPFLLVVFWSVDCEYCHDFLIQIRKNLDLRKDFELVTFALADSKKEVRRELRKLRLPGIHFYDEARWEGPAFLEYHVVSTPTVFLLDKDKTILSKPYDWEELNEIIKSL